MKRVLVYFCILLVTSISNAALIQHLDATVVGSITGNPVTRWADQSGNGNHAIPSVGRVYYPSTNISASGMAGLDFGSTRNSLSLLSTTKTENLLNFSAGGGAYMNSGICVLIAFKCNDLGTEGWLNDLIGVTSFIGDGGFGIRYGSNGAISCYLGGTAWSRGMENAIAAGDTVVIGFNYNARTGGFEFWDSKNKNSLSATVPAGNFTETGNILTLGSMNATGRYMKGMIGEVKIYNSVLDASSFKAERDNLAWKWAGIPIPASIRWRVILENPVFPTDDLVLAALSLDDNVFNHPLPFDPVHNDCTATFQEALDIVGASGGGTVFVPEGQYRLDGTLTIPTHVTLRGHWRPLTASQPAAGTILKIYAGRNQENATAFITAGISSGVRDLTFWYPEQDPDNIVPYPPAIGSSSDIVTLENITLINAYRGIHMSSSSMCFIDNIMGTTLKRGFYADISGAIPRFDKLNFGPEYWMWANLPDSTPISTAYQNYMRANGIGVDVRCSGIFMTDVKVRGMDIGMLSDKSPINGDISGGGDMTNLDLRDCNIAFQINQSGDMGLVNSYLQGTNYGLKDLNSRNLLKINNTTIMGGVASIESLMGTDLNISNCMFNGKIMTAGVLELTASEFLNTGTDIELNEPLDSAHIIGCRFADGTNIIDNSSSPAKITIDHSSTYGYSPTPSFPPKDRSIARKPATTLLFDIIDYGAIPDDGIDDSAAFGKAISLANNGGGIVFVPDGTFDVSGTYILERGVELRGISGSRHLASNRPGLELGSFLQITGNEGNPNGPAFLTLSSNCGIRGISFYYPKQRAEMLFSDTIIEYPFTVRASGNGIYIVDCTFSNPYQAINFYKADNHLLEKCLLGGLNKVIYAEECSGGRIEKFHCKPFWTDIWSGDFPFGDDEMAQFNNYLDTHLHVIWLKNCTNEIVYNIFNHSSHQLLRIEESTGIAFLVGGEGLQHAYSFSGSKDFELVLTQALVSAAGDRTGMNNIWLDSSFTGTVSAWMTREEGTADTTYLVQSGTLNLQQPLIAGPAERGNLHFETSDNGRLFFRNANFQREFTFYSAPEGIFSIQDSYFDRGIPHALFTSPDVTVARNRYAKSYMAASANSRRLINQGLVLDPTNLQIKDSPYSFPVSVYNNYLVTGAKTTDGDYNIDVINPAFINNNGSNITVESLFWIDTTCTIKIYYDSITGRKLGKSLTYD